MKQTDLEIDTARRALREAGNQLTDTDTLPAELVEVLARHDLPLSTLVAWIHFRPKGSTTATPALFAQHCQKFTGAARQLNYDRSQEPGICPQCHAHPTQRTGAFLVCTSGRCSPVADASPRASDSVRSS